MAGPLLESKLRLPRPRSQAVARSRLTEALARGWEAPVTLVCAPAGFGKTTLLSQWLAPIDDAAVAWVSLDERDNDPARFWEYVIVALQRATGSTAGAVTLEMLRPRGPARGVARPTAQRPREHHEAGCWSSSTTITSSRRLRSTTDWATSSITCHRTSISSSQREPIRRCRSRGYGPAECSSRFAPHSCASPATKRSSTWPIRSG